MKTLRKLTQSTIRVASSWRFAIGILLLLSAGACSSDATAPNGRPTGKWTGSLVSGTFTISMDLLMVEDAAGKVTGNGFISSTIGGATYSDSPATVTGTFVAPYLSANVSSPGVSTMNMSGKITGDTYTATLNGSGFFNETIVLTRQ